MSNKFKYIVIVLIGSAPSLLGADDFARNVFGITKDADELVLDALRDSGTMFWNTSGWKAGVLKPHAREEAAVGNHIMGRDYHNYHFDGPWKGWGNFNMRRQGDKLRVESTIETEDTLLPSSRRKDGFKMEINGVGFVLYSGELNVAQESASKYTKCEHTLHIGEKPADKTDKIYDVSFNRPTCSNSECRNPGCQSLRAGADVHDVVKTAGILLRDDAPKVRRVSKCVSTFPMNVLTEVLKK